MTHKIRMHYLELHLKAQEGHLNRLQSVLRTHSRAIPSQDSLEALRSRYGVGFDNTLIKAVEATNK